LSWLANDRLKVASQASVQLPELAPHADHVWELSVTPSQPGEKIAETLHLRLDYATLVGGKLVPQVVFSLMDVKSRELDALDKLVDVQVKTTLNSLETSRTGSVYLVISNKSSETFMVKGIAPIGNPDFIELKLLPDFKESTLQPYQNLVQEVQATAKWRVPPGKYLLIFKVTLDSIGGTSWREGSVIVSQDVTVGVVGESAILQALGLPSFFLLPGCLAVLAASLCWRSGWLRRGVKTGEFPLEYLKPDFWLVSITISLIMAMLYWLIARRWYFVSYGLQDIALVWFVSIILGILGYTVWLKTAESMEARRTFSKRDKPVDVLRKMHRLRMSLVLPRVALTADSKKEPRFVLQENDSRLSICPCICICLGKASDELKTEIRAQLKKDGDPRRLADLLDPFEGSSATYDWEGGIGQGVQSVLLTDTTPANEPDLVVKEVV
jgi:hypothetical protein